jgi:hypothetical protein
MNNNTRTIATAVTLVILLSLSHGCTQQPAKNYSWQQTENSIALLNQNKIVWRLNHQKHHNHPYFHPLALPDATLLTAENPSDHPWHWGLWFSWKYINGVNYWDPVPPKGRTEVTNVKTKLRPDNSARIELSINYRIPNQPPVLTEKRILTVSPPDKTGSYQIDWQSTFTAGKNDVILDRTPIPGQENSKSYGGYAGLSLRMADSTKNFKFLSSRGPLKSDSHGTKAQWLDFSGQTPDAKYAGITIFDHPKNLNHPTPWWLSTSMPFFSPAIIYKKPYTLKTGTHINLQYRILIHKDLLDKQILEKNWKSFIK